MTLDINYTTTNPRKVDQILETAIEELQQGGNAALTSLITQLAALGIITDTST